MTVRPRRKAGPVLAVLAVLALFVTGCDRNYVLVSSTPDSATGSSVANGRSWAPSVSGDGRYTVFLSDASNLVVGDLDGVTDVFVRDNATHQVLRYTNGSVDAASHPTISPDGSRIAYTVNLAYGAAGIRSTLAVVNRSSGSAAFREWAGDTSWSELNPSLNHDGTVIAWLEKTPYFTTVNYDSTGGRIVGKIPPRTNGTQTGVAANPKLDYYGAYVLFDSSASNYVTGDTNGTSDVFQWALGINTVKRVSVTQTGQQSNGSSGYASWQNSNDLGNVVFASWANNLMPGDTNGHQDIFESATPDYPSGVYRTYRQLTAGNNDSSLPTASGEGNYVSFVSKASNLVPDDTNSALDVFVTNGLGSTWRASVGYTLTQATGASTAPQISLDGRWVSYESDASDLADGDTNGTTDVFTSFARKVTVTSISPSVFTRGVRNYPVVINGSGFEQSSDWFSAPAPHVSLDDGQATFTNVHLVNDNKITANITVEPTAHPDETLSVGLPGPPIQSLDAASSGCACMKTVP